MEAFLPRRQVSTSRTSLIDDFDWDLNEISRSSSPLSAVSEGPRPPRTMHHSRSRHESRHKKSKYESDSQTNWTKLRAELEVERVKMRELQKEKIAELHKWKDSYEHEKKKELSVLEERLKRDKEKELEKIKTELEKLKDQELQQVLKYKDEEIKQLKSSLSQDELSISESISSRLNISGVSTQDGIENSSKKSLPIAHSFELMSKMEEEIQKLKDEKFYLEDKYGRKCKENRRKDKEFKKMKDDYDRELRKMVKDSKQLAMCNLKKLKIAELALSESMVSDDDSVSLHSILSENLSVRKLPNVEEGGENVQPSVTMETEDKQSDIMHVQENGQVDETKRDEREKERTLQKKITELQTQLQRLERRLTVIKTENETLKQRQDDQKPLEEKVKALKKRNAELAAIARRLEEKAKHLQQENLKKSKEDGGKDSDQLKKLFARQRAKDLAEHAKNMLSKDRELEDLRRKCHELADQISNGEISIPQNAEVYEEKEELVNIIKQAAKERLQMEKQLVKLDPSLRQSQVVQKGDQDKAKQLQEFEAANKELQGEIEELDKALQKAEGLDDALKEKENECETLKTHLDVEKTRNEELETDLRELAAQNSQLTLDITHFEKRLVELEGVSEECNNLRVHLAEAQTEREAAKEEVAVLQNRVDSLENLVRELHDSAEQLHQLENDYQQAIQTVDEKQEQIKHLQQVQEESRVHHDKALTSLKVKIQELENQCKFHENRNKDLNFELNSLRSDYPPTSNSDIQTDTNSLDILKRSETYPGKSSGFINSDPSSLFDNEYRYSNHQVDILPAQSNLTEANLSNTAAPTESSKSLDTGFAEEEETDGCNNSSPNKSDCDDPELYEIGKKLKELAVSESDDDGGSGLEGVFSSGRKPEYPERPSSLPRTTEDSKSGLERETEKEDSGMESNKEMKNPQEIALSDSRISSLSKKGQIYVYVAKYDYDPYTQSPNETPDSELPLNAGDYVLVFGEMDEDGFYEGELVDGRKGLVPSNFIEQVDSDHLADFHAAMAMAHSTVPVVDDGNLNRLKEEFDEYESSIKEPDVAYPRALSLDRQLSNGIYISWKPPDGGSNTEVQCYQVYVDGKLKSSVRGNERTKALVENIDMKQLHRVCVRCVTKSGHSSKDAQCTILVGKDSLPVPSEVRVSDVTATCATINWLPGNTNYQHSILVNGREASVVHAGVCRYTLTGLDPGTSHRIIVRAKNQSLNYDDERSRKRLEQLSAATEFRTKDAGPPDPPIGVQLETGPQEGTLLLTWIPVSLKTDENSSSSGVVIGYNIYIDGRKAKEATGATNDHIILYSADFNGYIPKQISVRTLASDGTESDESELLTLNNNLIKEISAGKNKPITPEVNIKAPEPRKLPKTTKQTGHAGPDTDEEIESAFLVNVEEEQKTSNAAVDPQYVEPYLESSSSELSDIQEVEEDLISTEETNSIAASGEAGGQLANQMKKSPRPVPSPRPASRKKSPSPGNVTSVEAGGHHGKHLSVNSNRDIPAIEITRDSSTEKSFEDEGVNSPKSAFSDNQSKSKSSPKESPRKTPEPLRRTHVPPKQEFGSGGAFRDASRHKQELAESDRQRQEVRSRDGKSTRSPVSPAYDRANTNPSRSRHSSGYSGHGDYDENGDVDSISGEINPPMDDNHVRLFIALFDYDPTIMSPNVEYIDEELPFREGQILKVYGDKDADGFYRGECNGQMGYIPCNMVSEIHIDDPELVDQLISESQGNPVSKSHLQTADKQIRNSQSASSQLTPNGISSSDGGAGKRRMVALYDYDPQELSPNVDSEIELSFKAGDIIMVSGDMDEDGFYMGEMNGVRGFVPSNFLQDSPLYDDEVLESASMVSPSRSGGSISTVSRQSESLNNVGVRGGITDMHVAPSPGSDGSADYTHRRNIATHRTSTTELRQPRSGSNNSPEVANARRQAQEKRRNFE